MAEGTVKFFNHDKGYGFIVPEGGGQDAFVHVSELRRSGIESLEEGQRLSSTSRLIPSGASPMRWMSAFWAPQSRYPAEGEQAIRVQSLSQLGHQFGATALGPSGNPGFIRSSRKRASA